MYKVEDEEDEKAALPSGPSYGREVIILCAAFGVVCLTCVCIVNLCFGNTRMFIKRCESVSSSELKVI